MGKNDVFSPRGQHHKPPSLLMDFRGLFVNPPSPPSGPHGLRMAPKMDWGHFKELLLRFWCQAFLWWINVYILIF